MHAREMHEVITSKIKKKLNTKKNNNYEPELNASWPLPSSSSWSVSPSQKAIITHTTIYLIPLLNDFQYTHSKTPNIPHKAFFSSFYNYYDGPVSGNANFNMPRTCLTLCGMTQPTTAFRLIVDKNNFSKGLASRFLWIFQGVFSATLVHFRFMQMRNAVRRRQNLQV